MLFYFLKRRKEIFFFLFGLGGGWGIEPNVLSDEILHLR
jgi:hypothetical protein